MKIELSNAIVTIKDNLTWGDSEKIQQALISSTKLSGKSEKDIGFSFDPSSMLEAKYVTLECLVTSIKEGEKEFQFSRDWMNNLSKEDGDKLYDAVDIISKK